MTGHATRTPPFEQTKQHSSSIATRCRKLLDAGRVIALSIALGAGLLLTGPNFSGPAAVTAQSLDAATLARLEKVIQAQQQQLSDLRQQLDALKKTTASAQIDAQQAKTTANKAIAVSGTMSGANQTGAAKDGDKTVTSGNDRIKLAISGQVNRMINVVDDGDTTKVFHVDNDNSSTRLRFVGSGKVTDDFTIGTNIEVQMESNSSATVSQAAESSGTVTFTDRKLEIFLDSKQYGKLSIGQGSMASDGTAEVDESGVDVLGYSSIADLAGGLLFTNSRTGALTAISIGGVFTNFDGLGRRDRLRYDSPSFAGFKASASHTSNDLWDAALRWGGETEDFRMAAAAAYAANNTATTDGRLDGSASILHKGSGLNLTVAAGGDEHRAAGRDPFSIYVKAGWRSDIFSIGETAFAVDWTQSDDVAATNDEATSIGAFAVQNLKEFGAQFYGGIRTHELNRPGTPIDDIWVFSAGTRVKF